MSESVVKKFPFAHGIRMKGGVGFFEDAGGFAAIVHTWDNAECLGEPEEWRSERVFKLEDEAMRYYKRKVRPLLKKAMREARRQGAVTAARELE